VATQKSRKLEIAVARIHHQFGSRALVKGRPLATPDSPALFPHISTGFRKLDEALGIGGLPKGRVSEMMGFPTSGKTTLALKFLAQAQADDSQVSYIDQARYFDPDYAHRCGLNLSHLLVGTPYDLGETLAMAEALARNGGLSAVILDLLDVFWTDSQTTLQLTTFLNHLPAPLARSGIAFLILHTSSVRGSPALSALAHYATVRLQVVREHWLHRHSDVRGYRVRVQVLKNRLGPAGQKVTIDIEFNGTVHGDGL
jgi:recombination protein RecA